MNKLNPSVVGLCVLLAVGSGVTGCNRTDESAKDNMDTGSQVTESNSDRIKDDMQRKADAAEGSISDTAITAKVKAAILADPALKLLQIHVDTVGGAVTLTGTVDSAPNLDHATMVVNGVEGVKSVSNKLEVKAPG